MRTAVGLVLLLTTYAEAQAVARILGPTGGKPGDLIVLDAGESVAASYAWEVFPAEARRNLLSVDGGKRAVFASGSPGVYTFVLAVAKQDAVATAVHTVDLGGPGPGPEPPPPVPPGPAPVPPPVPPAPLSEWATWARDSRATIGPEGGAWIASVAADLDTVAASAAAGVIRDPQAMLQQTADKLQGYAGWQQWRTVWVAKLRQANPTTLDELVTIWREIAKGLRA